MALTKTQTKTITQMVQSVRIDLALAASGQITAPVAEYRAIQRMNSALASLGIDPDELVDL